MNDEIIAVNNLDVDKHPLTLDRSVFGPNGNGNGDHSSTGKQGNQANPLTELAVSPATNDGPPPSTLPPLTKLDFTYQLIKHTLNRQLHLTVRRFVLLNCNGELTELTDLDELGGTRSGRFQSCCYYVDDQQSSKDANGESNITRGIYFCLLFLLFTLTAFIRCLFFLFLFHFLCHSTDF